MKSLKGQKKNKVLVRKEKGNLPVRWIKDIVNKLLDLQGLKGMVYVKGGLKEGDKIALDNAYVLQQGMKVEVR